MYRRLEARGELRGGRFVEGFSGEQFALPEALASLRVLNRQNTDKKYTVLSAVDPLNLMGVLTPGEKLTRSSHNRVVFQDGSPVAYLEKGELQLLIKAEPSQALAFRSLLNRQSTYPRAQRHTLKLASPS